jgi:hypothetical protein
MRALGASLCRRLLLLVDQQRSIAPGIGPAVPRTLGKSRPYKLPGAGRGKRGYIDALKKLFAPIM